LAIKKTVGLKQEKLIQSGIFENAIAKTCAKSPKVVFQPFFLPFFLRLRVALSGGGQILSTAGQCFLNFPGNSLNLAGFSTGTLFR